MRESGSRTKGQSVVLAGALLERVTDGAARGGFDLIAEDVVTNTRIIAAPGDDARPREPSPEGPAPNGPASFCPSDLPRDDPRKRPQKRRKTLPPAHPHEQMHVRPYVGEIVDLDPISLRTRPEDLAHGASMSEQSPFANGAVAMERHVHRTPRADGPLDLAPPAMLVSSVPCPRACPLKATMLRETSEKRKLHSTSTIFYERTRGNVNILSRRQSEQYGGYRPNRSLTGQTAERRPTPFALTKTCLPGARRKPSKFGPTPRNETAVNGESHASKGASTKRPSWFGGQCTAWRCRRTRPRAALRR